MRRLVLLFLPAFIAPCLVGFIIPAIALNTMDADLRSNRIFESNRAILTNGLEATDQDMQHTTAVRQHITITAVARDTATLAGTWVLQPVLASDTSTDRIPFIHFDLEKNRFSGFTGCNRMSGSLRLQGDILSFNPDLSVTKMICQGYNEKAFIQNLLRVSQYKITDGVLELRIDHLPVSKWVRKTRPMPIEKTI
jgi:heat shock protein HslJ